MDKNMEDKNKINFNPSDERDLNGSIFIPIIGVAFLAIGLFGYGHPVKDFNLMVTNIISIAFLFLAFSMFILFISDLWFVGKKFDAVYYEKVQDAGEKELRFKLPFVSKLPSIRPARTMMYSWGLISKKIQYKPVLGEDDLKASASLIDIIFAWLTIGTLVLGFVLFGIGAMLK